MEKTQKRCDSSSINSTRRIRISNSKLLVKKKNFHLKIDSLNSHSTTNENNLNFIKWNFIFLPFLFLAINFSENKTKNSHLNAKDWWIEIFGHRYIEFIDYQSNHNNNQTEHSYYFCCCCCCWIVEHCFKIEMGFSFFWNGPFSCKYYNLQMHIQYTVFLFDGSPPSSSYIICLLLSNWI